MLSRMRIKFKINAGEVAQSIRKQMPKPSFPMRSKKVYSRKWKVEG